MEMDFFPTKNECKRTGVPLEYQNGAVLGVCQQIRTKLIQEEKYWSIWRRDTKLLQVLVRVTKIRK